MRLTTLVAAALAACCAAAADGPGDALRDSDAGIAAGASAPDFRLNDQAGRPQTPASLMGPKGLALIFFRSADW